MNRKLRRQQKRRRRRLTWTGICLLVVGIVFLARAPYFYIRSHEEGTKLLKKATSLAVNKPTKPPAHTEPGQVLGQLVIPSLSLRVPLVEGTDDSQLSVGAGHLQTSALPGEDGTTLLAAHNATWFHHIDDLKQGALIIVETIYGTYTYRVTKSSTLHVGDDVANTKTPSLAMETCYPLNALYLTPLRYLVFADLVKSDGVAKSTSNSSPTGYTALIPEALRHDDLSLATNNLPMGTFTYKGNPSLDFSQSGHPLQAADALVKLYLAWVHASTNRDTHALSELVAENNVDQFMGIAQRRYRYLSAFNVTLNVQGDRLISMSADVDVKITHSFHVHLEAVVDPTREVALKSVTITRL